MAEKYQKIIQACMEGRRSAQEALYTALSSRMYGVCLRYATDSDEAQDMLQDGFIKVFSKLKQYKGSGSFEGWVRRIIVNTALEKIRTRNFTESIEDHPSASFPLFSLARHLRPSFGAYTHPQPVYQVCLARRLDP